MKSCPNCGELLGEYADSCFKCRYDYSIGRVRTKQELEEIAQQKEQQEREKRELEERRIIQEKEEAERQRILEQKRAERIRKETEKQEKIKREFIDKLPVYEYVTEVITDDRSGMVNQSLLESILADYAKDGWRLHTALSNEAGKNTNSIGYGGVSVGKNATIEQTILIFERLVSPGTL